MLDECVTGHSAIEKTDDKKLPLFAAVLLPVLAAADQHEAAKAEVIAAVYAFNQAYADNDADRYVSDFAEDADMFWSGAM